MGRLKRSKTEAIWYVSNERNQTLKSPFGPETGPSGASPNGALNIEPLILWIHTRFFGVFRVFYRGQHPDFNIIP